MKTCSKETVMNPAVSKMVMAIRCVLYIIILLIGYTTLLSAQSNAVDSLKGIIDKAQDDESRFEAINQFALYMLDENSDSAFLILDEIYPDVMNTNNASLKTAVLITRGRIYNKRQQLDSALVSFDAAKHISESNNDQSNVVECLIELGYVYSQKNESQEGLKLLKEALVIARTIDDKRLESRTANALGRVYSFLSEFDTSNFYVNIALGIEKELGNTRLVAEIYTNIANNYSRANSLNEAIEYYLLSQEIMRELKDSAGISHTYRNIGATYFFNGKYPEALENLHHSFQAVEGSKHHEHIIISLDYLGEVYMTIEDYENAQLYWEKAMSAWTNVNGEAPNPDLLFKKGRALLLQKSYKEALNVFIETEKLKKETGQFITGDLYWNIGQAYEMLSNYDAALLNYKEAEALSQDLNSIFIKTKSLYGLGKIYEVLNDKEQALTYYTNAYNLAQQGGLKENEMNAAKGLYRIYKSRNNHIRSLQFLEISTGLQDSLYNEKNTRSIARMQANFEFEQEKQELAFAQEKERREQANIQRRLWTALALAGFALLIGLFYFRSKQKANVELSKLNAQIIKQKEKLEVLDKAKSHFFTNISHEFRTPLTIIIGMLDKVHTKPDLWLDKGTKMIKENAYGLLNLVNQILDLRKLESNEMKVNMVHGDVVKYLHYIISSYESLAANKDLQIHFLAEREEIFMDYDADKTLRIVSNLLSNSIKFTPAGGDIYFFVDQKILNEQSTLQFKVQDTGVGIPKASLSKIFNRFYQIDDSTTRKGEGTGIGLALTQELVKLLGGKIQVESGTRKGSVFIVNLPIIKKANVQADDHFEIIADAQATEKGIAKKGLENPELVLPAFDPSLDKPQLLIIEDNPDVQQYLIACLEPEYQLILANNGQSGIQKAIEIIPDIIICDVMMPIKDGFEVCDTLKADERTSHIPIILLTAKADEASLMSGLRKGVDAYLTKPFNEAELLLRLEKLLELRKKLQDHYAKTFYNKEEIVSNATPENPFLQKFYALIEKELSNPDLDMNQICRALGMSRSQVFRKLKALTGKPATILIRSYRLQKGKELLAQGDLSVSDVAFDVGFTSLSYFSRAFQEEFGISPSATRK
ncbi:MAG: tetratricopeptide repeat protein [Chitinophagales bacterium]|nr:tetratricopeptide repeat protein [Chitinophagales bacterium]